MNELALFAGAGGGILGGKLLGWRTVCAVERDAYAAQVLAQRQNDGALPAFPIWSDVCSFDGSPWRGVVDVISGGFPCQDISVAGSGAGLNGERSGLWSEFARIIGEVRPRFAFIENSPRLAVLGLDRVLSDLAALGYDAEWMCLSAEQLGAHHERDRIWILARENADHDCQRKLQPQGRECDKRRRTGDVCEEVANAASQRQQGQGEPINSRHCATDAERKAGHAFDVCQFGEWPLEPGLGRVVDGMAYRMDRLEAIGNGQVPRVAAAAFAILAEQLMTANP